MGEMIENIAHQWRQPLSQINSATLVLYDEIELTQIKNDIMEKKLDEIESLTEYMSKTIDDFKSFYQNDKQKKKFNLKESVDIAVSLIKASLKYNNIEISIDINKDINIDGFKNEFEQAVLVILNNAKDVVISRKISHPKIEVNLNITDNLYILNICDNGGGIEKQYIDKIFDPYFTTKHKAQGTGLGLYLSKMILEENMNFRLYVKNLNLGACFCIEFDKEI